MYWIEYAMMIQTQSLEIRKFDLRDMIPQEIQEICNRNYELLVNGYI